MMRERRSVWILAAIVVALAPTTAPATTATVPTDYATIQQAVTAVQGTQDALVRIESNATFTENVTATESVTIEAGTGFSPTIQAVSTSCGVGSGSCAVGFLPTSDVTPMTFALRGVRLRPRNPTDANAHVVLVLNLGDVDTTVVIEDVVIEDPAGSGPGAVHLRSNAIGVVHATVRRTSVTLGGSAAVGTDAFVLGEGGSLAVEHLTMVMSGASGTVFNVGNLDEDSIFSLADSDITLNAPAGPYSVTLANFAANTDATIVRSRFRLNSNEEGDAGGFVTGSTPMFPRTVAVRMDANTFVGTGPKARGAVSLGVHANNVHTVIATNNVIRGLSRAITINLQAAGNHTDPGGTAVGTFTNNTIDGASEIGVQLTTQAVTDATLFFFNNLVTNGGGCALERMHDGDGTATVNVTAGFNGFFANAGGGCGGIDVSPDAVTGDPLYVDAAAGDLHLQPGSPMIDRGTGAAPELTATDADGAPRIRNGVVDIGAYEADASAATTTTTTSPGGTTTTTAPALLSGRVLQLADHPTRPDKRRLLVVAKGPDVGTGPKTDDDPVDHGGRLRVFVGSEPAGDYTLGGWSYRNPRRPEKGYRLRGSGPITSALVVPGKILRIVGKGATLAHRLGQTAPGVVIVELTLGSSRRNCLEFGGKEKFKAGRRLVRKNAGPATQCAPAGAN